MAIIKRNRVLRPSNRDTKSTYKIDTKNVGIDDTLYVTITHESDTKFREVYIFEGKDLVDKNSIHFSYDEECIKWLGNLTYSKLDNSEKPAITKKSPVRKKNLIKSDKNKIREDQIKWIDDFTLGYPNRIWRNAGITMLVIIILGLILVENAKVNIPNVQNTNIQSETKELVVVNGELVKCTPLPRSDYEIVYKWQETNLGKYSKECILERVKKGGFYRVLIGSIYYSCEPKIISNGFNFIFHDPNYNNGDYFYLTNGTQIYFISRMYDNGFFTHDGIIVIGNNGCAKLYMNDINNDFFELYTDLKPI